MASAMIEEAASPSKLALIRRFLRASGLQAMIDSGSHLDNLGMPGGPSYGFLTEGLPEMTYGESFSAPNAALREAYAPYRGEWQDEYEGHLNWEFTEPELEQIVTFLESAAGQHYLEAGGRMKAYIGTITEHLVEEIVTQAREILARRLAK